jgi:hypothetical protein
VVTLELTLALSAADYDKHNSADQADSARHRRESDPMSFLVRDFKRAQLGVFLLYRPTQSTPGKADHADDNQQDADDYGWFHFVDPTMAGGLRSTE